MTREAARRSRRSRRKMMRLVAILCYVRHTAKTVEAASSAEGWVDVGIPGPGGLPSPAIHTYDVLVYGSTPAGIIAAVAATLTGWLLATRVLDLEYAPQLSVIAISILVSVVLVWAVSRSGVRKALQALPQTTLRAP